MFFNNFAEFGSNETMGEGSRGEDDQEGVEDISRSATRLNRDYQGIYTSKYVLTNGGCAMWNRKI